MRNRFGLAALFALNAGMFFDWSLIKGSVWTWAGFMLTTAFSLAFFPWKTNDRLDLAYTEINENFDQVMYDGIKLYGEGFINNTELSENEETLDEYFARYKEEHGDGFRPEASRYK